MSIGRRAHFHTLLGWVGRHCILSSLPSGPPFDCNRGQIDHFLPTLPFHHCQKNNPQPRKRRAKSNEYHATPETHNVPCSQGPRRRVASLRRPPARHLHR